MNNAITRSHKILARVYAHARQYERPVWNQKDSGTRAKGLKDWLVTRFAAICNSDEADGDSRASFKKTTGPCHTAVRGNYTIKTIYMCTYEIIILLYDTYTKHGENPTEQPPGPAGGSGPSRGDSCCCCCCCRPSVSPPPVYAHVNNNNNENNIISQSS